MMSGKPDNGQQGTQPHDLKLYFPTGHGWDLTTG